MIIKPTDILPFYTENFSEAIDLIKGFCDEHTLKMLNEYVDKYRFIYFNFYGDNSFQFNFENVEDDLYIEFYIVYFEEKSNYVLIEFKNKNRETSRLDGPAFIEISDGVLKNLVYAVDGIEYTNELQYLVTVQLKKGEK